MEMQERENRKRIKKEASRVGWGLSIYNVFLFLMFVVPAIMAGIYLFVKYPVAAQQDAMFAQLQEKMDASGVLYIAGVSLGVLFLSAFFRKSVPTATIVQKGRTMNPVTFLQLLCIFMSSQLLFQILGGLLEGGLNLLGYSAMQEIETASSASTTISMFLYASFIGPIVEEVVYRGFVLRSFQKYGKIASVTISAILFGVMHGNLPQGIFAVGVGIVLGYVTLEYSIYWAMALHIVNNFIFGDALKWAFSLLGLSQQIQQVISMVIFVFFGVATGYICWRKRQEIKEYFRKNKTEKKVYLYIFSAVGVLIFIAMEMLMAIKGLQRI